MWKAGTGLAPALKEAPMESDNDHCGFNKAHGAPMFKFYEMNPHRATRFAKAMAGITSGDRPITELRDAFDWSRLQGKVVDVGGGSGHVSMTLARVS
jgi:2-polyprenyl-3-methyl-5-hydroxy-6-metoxy-1,4-benzoquinol methylase